MGPPLPRPFVQMPNRDSGRQLESASCPGLDKASLEPQADGQSPGRVVGWDRRGGQAVGAFSAMSTTTSTCGHGRRGKTLLRAERASIVAFSSIRCSSIMRLNIGRMKSIPNIQPKTEPWSAMVASYLKTVHSPHSSNDQVHSRTGSGALIASNRMTAGSFTVTHSTVRCSQLQPFESE